MSPTGTHPFVKTLRPLEVAPRVTLASLGSVSSDPEFP